MGLGTGGPQRLTFGGDCSGIPLHPFGPGWSHVARGTLWEQTHDVFLLHSVKDTWEDEKSPCIRLGSPHPSSSPALPQPTSCLSRDAPYPAGHQPQMATEHWNVASGADF